MFQTLKEITRKKENPLKLKRQMTLEPTVVIKKNKKIIDTITVDENN